MHTFWVLSLCKYAYIYVHNTIISQATWALLHHKEVMATFDVVVGNSPGNVNWGTTGQILNVKAKITTLIITLQASLPI